MSGVVPFLWLCVISSFIVTIQARAVNISNTWMLPEEGFPVFYRHFRDRVSWYEADAVCQFHHANLVTADTTSQYDAIRAYLKELDVTSNVWLGLSKTSENGKFTWSNYQALNGMGHWQDSIPVGNNPLCVVMDPSSDFLWKPMACGGPEVATFICELPIPDWATGPKGCLVTEIPSLTILYIPEHSAVELTSDCGLDGTKRIACKGNADREDILRQLTCTINQEDDFDDKSTKTSVQVTTQSETTQDDTKTTKAWIWTSNTIDVDYGIPTRHRRETEETLNPASTKSTTATESLSVSTRNTSGKEPTKAPQSELVKQISTISNPNQHEKPFLASFSTIESTMLPQTKPNSLEIIMETAPTSTNTHNYESSTMDTTNDTETNSPTPTTEEVEFQGAINQGQLFSIIENGTMFDFIELSEPDQIDSNKNNESEEYLSTTENVERVQPSLPPTVVKMKKEPKEDKHVKKSLPAKPKVPVVANINKEVEMLPEIHDTSLILNRTHRKEVPSYTDDDQQNKNIEKPGETSQQITTTKIYKAIKNEQPASVNLTLIYTAKVKADDKKPKYKQVKITATMQKKPLKPDLSQILTKHVPKKGVELEPHELSSTVAPTVSDIDTLNSSKTFDYEFLDNQSNNSLTSEPEKVPNRQRHLTRPQRKPFYPYFFSRVLG